MNTQYRKNLKAVLEASKSYCDESIESLKWELGTYDLSVETVNGTTMLLPTPANTIQATMVRVDGASEVCNNLWSNINIQTNRYLNVSNGELNYGEGFTTTVYIEVKPSTQYTITTYGMNGAGKTNCVEYNDNKEFVKGDTAVNLNGSATFTTQATTKYVRLVCKSDELDNSRLNLGSSDLGREPYFDGIHNLELSGLEVEGANLCNPNVHSEYNVNSSGTYSVNNEDVITITNTSSNNTNYGAYIGDVLEAGTYYYKFVNVSGLANATNLRIVDNTTAGSETTLAYLDASGETFTIANNGYFRAILQSGLSMSFKIIISKTNIDYEPYVSQTLPIDLTSIEDSGGNKLFADGKLGSAGTVCDELAPYKAIARTREVVLNGTENWFISDTNDVETKGKYFYLALDNCYQVSSGSEVSEITATYFNAGNPNSIYGGASDKPYISYWSSVQRINLYDRNTIAFMTLAEFKQWLATRYANGNPIVVRYRYATPIEANINLLQLVKFEAHSNGSITLVNTNNQDTTSTFKYLKEVAK